MGDNMKTYSVKASEIKRQWHVIDASGEILGRLAADIAKLLMGKHKPIFSRHLDTGDCVIVINAAKVHSSGNKLESKIYSKHSSYPGGLTETTLGEMLRKKPTWVIEHAVKGMLPKNSLGAKMLKKLKVYAGEAHPHLVQTSSGDS
jgi:large subunit ribosomal protein L13